MAGDKLKKGLASGVRITKKAVRATLIGGAMLGTIVGGLSLWADWTYQVRTNYGVVVTNASGVRSAVTQEGWHWRTPFVSKYEGEYALANQEVFWEGKPNPHKVITDGGNVIMASATTFYSISDLHKYAIENVKEEIDALETVQEVDSSERLLQRKYAVSPRDMIQRTLDSLIGGYIQKTSAEQLIHHRSEVEKEIYALLLESDVQERYGITLNGFSLTETSYIPRVVEADAKRQELEAIAEGKKAAATINKEAIETLAQADAAKFGIIQDALNPQTPEEKMRAWDIYQSLVKYRTLENRKGDTIWMLNGQDSPQPTFVPKKTYSR